MSIGCACGVTEEAQARPPAAGPPGLPAYALPDAELLRACRCEALRGSGPGGQHRNQTATGVRLVHPPTGCEARADRHREAGRNRAEALLRLRLRLAIALPGGADPAWLAPFRRGRRLPLTPASSAYVLACACALDALVQAEGSLPTAAQALGVSTTQLAKLLTADAEVRAAADGLRARHGLGAIHG